MSDLKIALMTKEELIELVATKNKRITSLVVQEHDKDVLIQNLRIFVEELQKKKFKMLSRIIDQRKDLTHHKEYHAQEIRFFQEEIDCRDEKIVELEEQLSLIKRRTL